MTWNEMEEFVKKVVLHYLPKIVSAEERNQSMPVELTHIAYGLGRLDCMNFVSIMKEKYKIIVTL